MPTVQASPQQNHLLGAIPETEWERFAPHLTPVNLRLGEVIYESGSDQPHVYFPTDSIISLLYVMENGASAEIAIVGNEGLVGIALFMGAERRPVARLCRVPDRRSVCALNSLVMNSSSPARYNSFSCAIRKHC